MTWLIVAIYVGLMLATSVPVSRRLAVTPGWSGSCRGGRGGGRARKPYMIGSFTDSPSTCRDWHSPECWYVTGEVNMWDSAAAVTVSAAWPLVLPVVLLNRAANRKPTEVALRHRIKELEREVGIE